MSAMAAAVVKGSLHVVGGEDPAVPGGRVIDAHYVLHAGAPDWVAAPKPPTPTHGAGYGAYRGKLIIAGGATRQGLLSFTAWSGSTLIYTDVS